MKRRGLRRSSLASLFLLLAVATSLSCASVDSTAVPGPENDLSMSPPTLDLSGVGCGLVTCKSAGARCGLIGDGCGGVIDCGGCSAPAICGGGGKHFECGGDATCKPLGQAQACGAYGATCGMASDGCGGTVSCGSCTAPETCGGGGKAFACGTGGGTCTPITCAMAGATCGLVGNGCGGTMLCGLCFTPQTCGGGGVPGKCGAGMCKPRTCAAAGATCGYVGDGCGGIINYGGGAGTGCGVCTAPAICGGSGIPNNCGATIPDMGGCTGLCLKQTQCDAGTTTLEGTVTAPGHDDTAAWGTPDPISGALVYVPNGPVAPFPAGVSCDRCDASVTGSPLVSVTTGVDGKFSLTNAPCGVDVPVIIQLGRWRRQITVPAVKCCTTTTLSATQTHLPRKHTATDNIPAIAVVTGSADPMECVLPKIGIDPSEFTDPTGTGRVNFYQASSVGAGAVLSGSTPKDTALWSSLATMKKYDLIIIDCEGAAYDKASYYSNLLAYTAAGGRIYLSHYGFAFLHGQNQTAPPALNAAWNATATWQVNPPTSPPDQTAFIDTTFPKGVIFAKWLQLVSGGTLGEIPVTTVRHDFTAVVSPSQQWMYGKDPSLFPMHYTFNTPTGAAPASQCGRVMYSDFHVSTGATGTGTFPAECSLGTGVKLTPQEKVLEYMLFDLTSCVRPDVPMCAAKSCADLGYSCGMQGDGCGNVINCGACTAPQTCGGGGTHGVCGGPTCTPLTCAKLGYKCGAAGDGCGGLLFCGVCAPPNSCGGGGKPGICGNSCVPATCASLNLHCGKADDGCGGMLSCGTCPTGQSCGGGGTPGVCGGPTCTPKTCAMLGYSCGTQGDGCGGSLSCGSCTPPQSCGGGGRPGVCGAPSCTPTTCAVLKLQCGTSDDGCGGTLNCGSCPAGQSCGGGGMPGMCGAPFCTPTTCAKLGYNCGAAGDGCGGVIGCGTCSPPEICGGAGKPGVCGTGRCTPATCASLKLQCGRSDDGCGGMLSCGSCPAGQTCGGGGTPGMCGGPMCSPRTCAAAGADCGIIGDGCGRILNCGTCAAGQTCGAGGFANKCGTFG